MNLEIDNNRNKGHLLKPEQRLAVRSILEENPYYCSFFGYKVEKFKPDQILELEARMEENRKAINQQLTAYESLLKIHIHDSEFEKTPKRSIKRFLYKLEE